MTMHKKIRFSDYSDYDPNLCHDGGRYGFWTDYIREESGNYRIEYGTTSDMEFCPCCGSFNDHYRYDPEDGVYYECGDFERISEAEVKLQIEEFEENHKGDENYFISWQD